MVKARQVLQLTTQPLTNNVKPDKLAIVLPTDMPVFRLATDSGIFCLKKKHQLWQNQTIEAYSRMGRPAKPLHEINLQCRITVDDRKWLETYAMRQSILSREQGLLVGEITIADVIRHAIKTLRLQEEAKTMREIL